MQTKLSKNCLNQWLPRWVFQGMLDCWWLSQEAASWWWGWQQGYRENQIFSSVQARKNHSLSIVFDVSGDFWLKRSILSVELRGKRGRSIVRSQHNGAWSGRVTRLPPSQYSPSYPVWIGHKIPRVKALTLILLIQAAIGFIFLVKMPNAVQTTLIAIIRFTFGNCLAMQLQDMLFTWSM